MVLLGNVGRIPYLSRAGGRRDISNWQTVSRW